MEFCCKCGSLMMPKKKNGKVVLECTSCSYSKVFEGEMEMKQKKKKTASKIHNEEKEEGSMPVVKEQCPKCKNKEAYFWTVQTRAADEPPTKFYRCTKCGHTWRDYS